jgi:hypothetical protein
MAEPTDSSGIDPDREALLGVLARHGVAFVLIGGAAIQSHGRRYDTQDIDLTPDTEPKNLSRLADALNELDCRLVTDPADTASWVVLPPDYFTPRGLLAASVWNLATRHGQLDLAFTPTGFPGGYSDLASRAVQQPAAGTTVLVSVAALEDVHQSKRQADRPKDREYFRQAETG